MSVSRGCLAVRWTDKKWYCIVAQEEHDYEFDDFLIYGPADTEDKAVALMDECEPNPGGLETIEVKKQKDLWLPRIAKAIRKYIKNGYQNPGVVKKTETRYVVDW